MCDHCLAHQELQEAVDEFVVAARKELEREKDVSEYPLELLGNYKKKPIVVKIFRASKAFTLYTNVDGKSESTSYIRKGDLVIQGTHNELYPIQPDVFIETYEKVS